MHFDINVETIYVIVKKRENKAFYYNCENRRNDGFLYILSGNGVFENKNGKIKLTKDTMLVLQKGDSYSVKALDDDFKYITTAFIINPKGGFRSLEIPVYMQLEEQPYIKVQMEKLLETWEQRSALYTLKTRIIIQQIILNLFEISTKSSDYTNNENRLNAAITYINQHYDKPICTKELADLCKLSVSHFRKLFDEQFGVSPMKYREAIRIYWAKRLLKSNFFTVSEIAVKLGYYDVYHFSKDFKKYTQKTPMEYKKGEKSSEKN